MTPDSFSDGGQFTSEKTILQAAEHMIAEGADIIDIGGESTRPYAQPVPADEEIRRVLPAISAIRQRHNIPISIDTSKAKVAELALDAGADIINDISAMRFDTAMAPLAAKRQCPAVIMHMQGTPADMQIQPKYADVISETLIFFKERIQCLVEQGIDRQRIILDPGIGFGKTLGHNLAILNRTAEYQILGCPLLIGHSRKSFLAALLGQGLTDRDLPTAVLSGLLARQQVAILRVHNVLATAQAIRLSQAIAQAM